MKKLVLALSAVIPLVLSAQTTSTEVVDIETDDNVKLEMITPAEPVQESKQEIKEREKRMRELSDDVAYGKASNSMRRGYFVLIADYIQIGKMGYRHYDINPNSNFILVQNEDGILQYAINTGAPLSNGLGGWTGKGKVRNKRIEYADNGDVYMQYQLISGKVNANIDITLFHNTNSAVAHITGGYDITLYGKILPYRDKKHR